MTRTPGCRYFLVSSFGFAEEELLGGRGIAARVRHCFQKLTGGIYMSGSTSRSLLAALKAAGAASILSWAVVLSVWVPRWRIRIRLPAIQGLSRHPPRACRLPLTRWWYQLRAPLRGRTRHRSPA